MQPRMQDAPIVRSIKALGGIVLCKAAVPWHLLFSDVSSPVFGTAVHPDKPHLSLGGSGGAMCALIAMSEETDGSSHRRRPAHPGGGSGGAATPSRGRGHCCLVGIGGDEIGGVRIAAQHCGQFALKPSSARLPCGTHDSAWDTLVRVASPASSSLASIVHVVRSLAVPEIQHREPGTVPLAFNQPAFESASCPDRPLRIGYIVNDGVMHASPASKRAVLTAISAIQAHGRSRPTRIEHQAIRISPPNPPAHRPPPDYGFLSAADHLQSVDDVVSPPNGLVLLAKLFSYGRHRATQATKCLGRVSLRDQLTRIEPVFPLLLLMRVPQLVRSLASRLMSALLDDAVLASVVRFFGGSPSWAWLAPRSAESLEQLEREKQALARLYADMWEHHKLDAIVCPGSFYSAVWNLLDYAAGVVPNVTRVQPTDLVGNVVEYAHAGHSMLPAEPLPLLPAMPPTAQLAPGALESQQHRLRAAQYDPARHARARIFNFLGVLGIEESNHSTMDGSAVGCGVGVQVVCRRFEEENVVGVMSVIEQGLRMVETDS
nr:hypothetical protein HK105_005784 [Polyrhizophydium stewartii]